MEEEEEVGEVLKEEDSILENSETVNDPELYSSTFTFLCNFYLCPIKRCDMVKYIFIRNS